jgi:hypothetical protein
MVHTSWCRDTNLFTRLLAAILGSGFSAEIITRHNAPTNAARSALPIALCILDRQFGAGEDGEGAFARNARRDKFYVITRARLNYRGQIDCMYT